MKMVDKSSKLDKFSANMNASTSAGAGGGGGGGVGVGSGGGVGNTGATGGVVGMNTNITGHYYHGMQQQQQQHHGSSSHHQNGQKPVPMKLFAAWEVDRTPPNCIPR